MLSPRLALLVPLVALALFSGCTIAQTTVPPPAGTQITKVYVEDNPKVLMKGFLPEVVTQVQALGFETEVYSGIPPKDAKHTLAFTANWRWDMAMYLFYFQATLMENGRILGTAEYDARMGGGNPGKFGATAEKIKPLLRQLFSPVTRGSSAPAAPPLAAATGSK